MILCLLMFSVCELCFFCSVILYHILHINYNWHINNLFDILFEMAFGPTKGGKLHTNIMHIIILANQKTYSFVYHWLCKHANAFPHLSEHRTSSQVFCQYVNYIANKKGVFYMVLVYSFSNTSNNKQLYSIFNEVWSSTKHGCL